MGEGRDVREAVPYGVSDCTGLQGRRSTVSYFSRWDGKRAGVEPRPYGVSVFSSFDDRARQPTETVGRNFCKKNGACGGNRTLDLLFTREMPPVNKVNSLPVCRTSELCERSMCKCPPWWKRARQPTEPVGRNFCKKMELVEGIEPLTYSLRGRCRL